MVAQEVAVCPFGSGLCGSCASGWRRRSGWRGWPGGCPRKPESSGCARRPAVAEVVEEFLRPPHGEGGDDHDAAAAVSLDDVRQGGQHVLVRVQPVAVGGLQDQQIRLRHRRRIGQDMPIVPAQVAGKHQAKLPPSSRRRVKRAHGRTQDVTRVQELEGEFLLMAKGFRASAEAPQGLSTSSMV